MKKRYRRAARGSGSVRLRKDGSWEARISTTVSDGSRRQLSLYGRTREEALRRANERRHLVIPSSTALRLDEYLQLWLRRKRDEWSGATYLLYKGYVEKRLSPALGKHALSSLRREHVLLYLDKLTAEGVGTPTRAAILKTLKTALNAAGEAELVARNVTNGIRPPRVIRKPIHIPSLDEFLDFLNAARGSDYYALYVLAAFGWMREGELFALDWRNVNLEDRFVTVTASLGVDHNGRPVIKQPKTQSSRRRIPLPQFAVDALAQTPAEHRSGLVFTDSVGQPLRKSNFLRREFLPLLKRAGVTRFRFHALRHAGNFYLADDGVSVLVLKERGGWTSTRMPLDVYGHLSNGIQNVAAARLDDLVQGALAKRSSDNLGTSTL